jgi:hypothetical protein
MVEWCRRDDFRKLLPALLEGEDEEFSTYIRSIADKYSNITMQKEQELHKT